jgi:hypothetical protein
MGASNSGLPLDRHQLKSVFSGQCPDYRNAPICALPGAQAELPANSVLQQTAGKTAVGVGVFVELRPPALRTIS